MTSVKLAVGLLDKVTSVKLVLDSVVKYLLKTSFQITQYVCHVMKHVLWF